MEHSNTRSGFTLVELSIVLVIIGLIVSSVLVGQDLVRQAELRSTVTQFEQFQAAVKTFKTKYNALPGDVTGATTYGWTGDGDNDGVLDAGPTGHAATDNVFFWSHLGASGAGLISGTYDGAAITTASTVGDTLPEADAGNFWGVFYDSTTGSNNYIIGATQPSTNSFFTTTATLIPSDALSLDSKIDDSRPGRGIVQTVFAAANAPNTTPINNAGIQTSATPTDTGDECTYEATATFLDSNYNTSESSATCVMRLRF